MADQEDLMKNFIQTASLCEFSQVLSIIENQDNLLDLYQVLLRKLPNSQN